MSVFTAADTDFKCVFGFYEEKQKQDELIVTWGFV